MTGVDALYYDGHSARSHPVTLTLDGNDLVVLGDGVTVTAPVGGVQVTSRLARIRRVLQLPDGSEVHCDDNDAIDALLSIRPGDTIVDRLERHTSAMAASLVVIALSFTWFFMFGLPQLADRIAREIPYAAEVMIGKETLATLDRVAFQPSTVDAARQKELTQEFGDFIANIPAADRYRLEFRKLGGIANALALPGGTIVVTDALVESMGDDNAFLAVTAHELGHQEHRHLMRSVLQGSAIVVLVTLFTGDVSSATGVVLAIPTFLLNSHYSREFEREADAYAFAALRDRDISPEWFAYAISTIEDGLPVTAETESNYMSSHPASSDRIIAARAAAEGFDALEVLVARSTARLSSDGTSYAVSAIEGCWSGLQDLGDDQKSHWRVSLGGDGDMRARFRLTDNAGDLIAATTNTGRWALQDEIMTVRMLTADQDTGEVTQIDRLQTYTIDAVTADQFDYESLQNGEHFTSTRFDCAQFDDE